MVNGQLSIINGQWSITLSEGGKIPLLTPFSIYYLAVSDFFLYICSVKGWWVE